MEFNLLTSPQHPFMDTVSVLDQIKWPPFCALHHLLSDSSPFVFLPAFSPSISPSMAEVQFLMLIFLGDFAFPCIIASPVCPAPHSILMLREDSPPSKCPHSFQDSAGSCFRLNSDLPKMQPLYMKGKALKQGSEMGVMCVRMILLLLIFQLLGN